MYQIKDDPWAPYEDLNLDREIEKRAALSGRTWATTPPHDCPDGM